jgi:hypothetical protein
MAGQKLRSDGRYLPAAARDSCRLLSSLVADLVKGPPVAIQRGFLPGQRLPALHDDVDVLRVQLEAKADSVS